MGACECKSAVASRGRDRVDPEDVDASKSVQNCCEMMGCKLQSSRAAADSSSGVPEVAARSAAASAPQLMPAVRPRTSGSTLPHLLSAAKSSMRSRPAASKSRSAQSKSSQRQQKRSIAPPKTQAEPGQTEDSRLLDAAMNSLDLQAPGKHRCDTFDDELQRSTGKPASGTESGSTRASDATNLQSAPQSDALRDIILSMQSPSDADRSEGSTTTSVTDVDQDKGARRPSRRAAPFVCPTAESDAGTSRAGSSIVDFKLVLRQPTPWSLTSQRTADSMFS